MDISQKHVQKVLQECLYINIPVILKSSLKQQIYKFSRLLVLAMLTRQAPETYPSPCKYKFHCTALDKTKTWWWHVNETKSSNLENLYNVCAV